MIFIEDLIVNDKWTLITTDDPAFLAGTSISEIIHIILQIIEFKFIVLHDIQGAAEAVSLLEEKENQVMLLSDFMKIVPEVIQFDWGDFFLFQKYPIHWNDVREGPYSSIIAQTDTTIRAVDDQYIYVYTPCKKIVEVIKEKYEIESIKTDILENLDYPY